MSDLIVTHPGSAHFDEFLAISLLIGVKKDQDFRIERRNPTDAELNDPAVWVIDIGGSHEPALKNFDHHQSLNVSASFVLVADYLDLTATLKTAPWWSYKDKIDRLGPVNVARELGIKELSQTFSPLEEWFLNEFAEEPMRAVPFMRAFGNAIIREAEKLSEQIEYWQTCDIHVIKNKRILVGHTKDSAGLETFSRQIEKGIDISVTYDRRGPGWRLYRFDDRAGVDFALLEDHDEIFFAHKGGFLAKTKARLPLDQIFNLIAQAID